jgi:hypothetical protein
LMNEGEAFYQLQQVALIFQPNLGGWRLDCCLLVSLMLTFFLPVRVSETATMSTKSQTN